MSYEVLQSFADTVTEKQYVFGILYTDIIRLPTGNKIKNDLDLGLD